MFPGLYIINLSFRHKILYNNYSSFIAEMNIIVNICILCLMVLKINQVAGCYAGLYEPTWGGGVDDGYNWYRTAGYTENHDQSFIIPERSLEDPLDATAGELRNNNI